jgi:perosamine synthetase
MSHFYPISAPSIGDEDIALVTDAIKSGWVSSLGPYLDEFEAEFARYCGTKYALTTSNGTTALHLALLACGISQGDEVIVPDLTFIATANAVSHSGALPIPVDIESTSLCIDANAIRNAITPNTKAIVPVHLYGHPASMGAIAEIAAEFDLYVIEDAAEAHGAEYLGKRVGGLGDCGVFSFYGNKIITSGEGGMLTTNSDSIYLEARKLRDHAMSPSKRYWHDAVGYNYRMTNLQAALGLAQLRRIDQFLADRTRIMRCYESELGEDPRIRLNRRSDWAKNVHWMVCVEIEGLNDERRQSLMKDLKTRGIDSRPYFYPVSDMPMYSRADTPVAHRISPTGLNLPSYVGLRSEDVSKICREFRDCLKGLSI